jgi:hypothetical protein
LSANLQTLELPVVFWLSARTRLAGGPADDGWLVRDPVVRHLAPVLWALERQGCLSLGSKTRRAAARTYFNNHARWLLWDRRLKELSCVLRDEGVALIPLKGVILKSQLYGDNGLREMSDVDILVRDEDFWKAAGLLRMAGLKPTSPEGIVDVFKWQNLPQTTWPLEQEFQDENGLNVELHRHLLKTRLYASWFDVDMTGLWARSIPVDGAGGLWTAYLSPYDMLAHLCLHQALHGLHLMHGFLDIDLFIRRLPADWDWARFARLAAQWQIRSAAYHSLLFCKYFMGTPFPEEALARLDPGKGARWRVSSLVTAHALLAGRPTLGSRFPSLVRLALVDSYWRIIRLAFQVAFPDKTWVRQRYGGDKTLLWFWKHIWEAVSRGD